MDYKASCPSCGMKMARRYIFSEPTIYHRCRGCGVRYRPTNGAHLAMIGFLGIFILVFLLRRMHVIVFSLEFGLIAVTFGIWVWLAPYIMPVQLRPQRQKQADDKPTA
jgi:rubredoxin